jgi:histidyl-tRNA synthetase
VERTVLALRAEGVALEPSSRTQVFAVPIGEEARRALFGVITELHRKGVAADFAYGGKGMKNAMKSANRSGARYALVLGERDRAGGAIQVKDLDGGEQTPAALDEAAAGVPAKLNWPSDRWCTMNGGVATTG